MMKLSKESSSLKLRIGLTVTRISKVLHKGNNKAT